MQLARRLGLGVVVLVALAVIAVGAIGASMVRRPWPQVAGEIALEGLGGPVTVIRDGHGIPQIYADNPADLFRAQGFVTAQDRFFEMDLRRHATAGRLAELVGKGGLDSDKVVRTLGWRRVSEEELPKLAPSTRQYLGAYAEGVNDYLAKAGEPSSIALEYTLLGSQLPDYRIEPWSALDSLTWLKAMAWDLKGNFGDELARARLATSMQLPQVAAIYPAYPGNLNAPILSPGDWAPGERSSRANSALPTALVAAPGGTGTAAGPAQVTPVVPPASLPALTAAAAGLDAVAEVLGRGDGIGSNSWVVGPAHSSTGKPLLANDPHLGVSIPGIWMQVGLHCRTVSPTCPFDVSGFTFSGLPGVLIGHNESIAWGFTNLSPDVCDFYLEQATDTTYLRDGQLQPLVVTAETLKVRGGDDVPLLVRATSHGPIVSDVFPTVGDMGRAPVVNGVQSTGEYAVSLAWTGLIPGTTADAIFALDAAKDFDSFRQALRSFAVPSQNVVYADTSGSIGYQAPGVVPVRRSSTPGFPPGYLPAPGWDSQWDWQGSVPYDDLPWTRDPAEGLIVTANQEVSAAGPFLTSEWDAGYRAQRIRALLSARATITPVDMASIQLDNVDPFAKTLVGALLTVDLKGDSFTAAARDLLVNWDGSTPADSSPNSAAAAYFNAVWATLLSNTFDDQLPRDLWADGGSRWRLAVTNLLGDPANSWWDDKRTPGAVENRDEILHRALVDARLELTRSLGPNVENWSWGKLHTLTLAHRVFGTDGTPGWVQSIFDRGPIPLPGGSSIVDANGWNAAKGYAVNWAPSMRMVVDLGSLDSSTWVNQTGQSGHAYNPHYVDQVDAWASGGSFPWPFSSGAVAAAKVDELTLTPKG